MSIRLQYDITAKVFHWLIVGLLIVKYLIGWLMPDIHRGDRPGAPMTFHVSLGIAILALIVLRLVWRLTHPVAPESSLPPWQRLTSEAVHWMLYALVLATTITGWLFASFRGWSLRFFYLAPLPCWPRTMRRRENSSTAGIRRWSGRCWRSSGFMSHPQWPTSSSTVTGSCNACCRDRLFCCRG
jgi:cytochrome b561